MAILTAVPDSPEALPGLLVVALLILVFSFPIFLRSRGAK